MEVKAGAGTEHAGLGWTASKARKAPVAPAGPARETGSSDAEGSAEHVDPFGFRTEPLGLEGTPLPELMGSPSGPS